MLKKIYCGILLAALCAPSYGHVQLKYHYHDKHPVKQQYQTYNKKQKARHVRNDYYRRAYIAQARGNSHHAKRLFHLGNQVDHYYDRKRRCN